MFRNIGFGAAALLAAGALAMGCSDDGDVVLGGSVLLPDNFPGSQEFESNLADDGRAASNQGQDYNFNGEVFWNVTNGTAIGLYTTDVSNDNSTVFYGAFFDSRQWHRPVQIVGRDLASGDVQEPKDPVQGFKVCFINTSSTSGGDANVAARDGDAVILFTRKDEDEAPGVTTEEDDNIRLWATYFDSSAANAPAANGVQGGFTTDAITLDTDNLITAGNDPDVSDFGFVSDSLQRTHFFGSGTDNVDSGEPTTFLAIVYRKDINSGTVTGTSQRWLSRSLIGDAADNDLDNLFDAQETLPAAVNAPTTNEGVNQGFVVHNDLMFWNHVTVINTGESETIGTVTQFDADGVADQVSLGESAIDNGESDSVFYPAEEDVYGGDDGLASTYFLFNQSGYQADATPQAGEAVTDTDLFVGQIDNDAALAIDTLKIDNFADTFDPGTAGTTAARTGRSITNFGSRMGRTGEYITVLYQQENTDASTDTSNPLVAINTNLQLFATVVQTRVTDPSGTTAARALDDSVFDATVGGSIDGVRVPAQLSSGQITTLTGEEGDVNNVEFQIELLSGEATSQADDSVLAHDRSCVIQSDAYRMNFTYTQLVDGATGTGTDEERLLVNGVAVTLDTTGSAAPDLDLITTSEELIATRDTGWTSFQAVTADAGDVTRDATTGLPAGDSGRPLVIYTLNGNNPADDGVTGVFTENRLFVYDGSSELLSTDGAREFDQVMELLAVETVPASATTTHHAGTTLHVIWAEAIDTNDGDNQQGMAIVTRSYDKGAINDGAATNDNLENRFTPNLVGGTAEDDPVQIDNPVEGDLMDTQFGNDDFTVGVAGSTVGVYFTEDDHLYYNDTATDALGWDLENGISAPQLVDNASPTGQRVRGVQMFFAPECDNLTKSQAFFVREETSQAGFILGTALRFYLRVHN